MKIMLNSMRKAFSFILKLVGVRKTILCLYTGNWFDLPWDAVLKDSWQNRIRYDRQVVSFNDLLQAGAVAVLDFEETNYRGSSYRGYNLWELTKTGILASLETSVLRGRLNVRQQKVVRFYFEKAAQAINGAHSILQKYNPISIVTVQGCNPMARPLVEVARRAGVHVAAVEAAFLGGYLFCDDATGMIVNRHRAATLDHHWLPARSLSPEERRMFREQYDMERLSKRAEHQTGTSSTYHQDLYEELNISRNRKIAVFIGQVMTDAAIIMDSNIFPDPLMLIHGVVDFFASQPDWFLIIRLHPKEDGGSSWINGPNPALGYGPPPEEAVGPLPYNRLTHRLLLESGVRQRSDHHLIVHSKSISTDLILDAAHIGITITSQAGFEFVLKYKRLVVCGDAFYGRKGFTYDVGHPSALQATLSAAILNTELSEDEKYKADQYGDHLLNRVLFRKDMRTGKERLLGCITGESQRLAL
jgi:hypothetical protein